MKDKKNKKKSQVNLEAYRESIFREFSVLSDRSKKRLKSKSFPLSEIVFPVFYIHFKEKPVNLWKIEKSNDKLFLQFCLKKV